MVQKGENIQWAADTWMKVPCYFVEVSGEWAGWFQMIKRQDWLKYNQGMQNIWTQDVLQRGYNRKPPSIHFLLLFLYGIVGHRHRHTCLRAMGGSLSARTWREHANSSQKCAWAPFCCDTTVVATAQHWDNLKTHFIYRSFSLTIYPINK